MPTRTTPVHTQAPAAPTPSARPSPTTPAAPATPARPPPSTMLRRHSLTFPLPQSTTAATLHKVAPTRSAFSTTSFINDTTTPETYTLALPDALPIFALLVDWGDGSSQTYNLAAGATSFDVTHAYTDNPGPHPSSGGTYAIGATLTHNARGTGNPSPTATVNNAAPTLTDVSPSTVNHGRHATQSRADAQRLFHYLIYQ